MKRLIALALASAVLTLDVSANEGDWDGKVLYRYTDDNGVQVLDHSVPPRFVARGYEVITPGGRVLQVVEPALTGEQLAEKQRREAREAADLELLRRYNSVADIESARTRKLSRVQQDIGILRSTIANLETQIERDESFAARTQRNGGTVTEELVQRIKNLHEEVEVMRERLTVREKEVVEIEREFDQAANRYQEIAGQ